MVTAHRQEPRAPTPRRWWWATLALAPALGLACGLASPLGVGEQALSAVVLALAIGLVTLALLWATRGPALPATFGALFLAALWLASPAEQLYYASDRDTPGRTQIVTSMAVGGSFDRLTAEALDESPVLSPDGRQLAFVRHLAGQAQLYIADRQGWQPRPFPGTAGNNSHPAWSPDGRWLAFASDRSGDWEIYAASRDGTQLRNLSRHPGYDDWPTWSPDGQRLAYHVGRDSTTGLALVDFGSGVSTIFLADRPARQPAWSPVGDALAFVNGPTDAAQICVVTIADRTSRCLTPPGHYAMPAWSPSGRSLAYVLPRDVGSAIAVIPASGGAGRIVSPATVRNTTPSWSRGGPTSPPLLGWLRLRRW